METDPTFTTNIKPPHSRANVDKRTIKYLEVCTDPRTYSSAVRTAPDSTIRGISAAALNVERGPVHLTPKQKAVSTGTT